LSRVWRCRYKNVSVPGKSGPWEVWAIKCYLTVNYHKCESMTPSSRKWSVSDSKGYHYDANDTIVTNKIKIVWMRSWFVWLQLCWYPRLMGQDISKRGCEKRNDLVTVGSTRFIIIKGREFRRCRGSNRNVTILYYGRSAVGTAIIHCPYCQNYFALDDWSHLSSRKFDFKSVICRTFRFARKPGLYD